MTQYNVVDCFLPACVQIGKSAMLKAEEPCATTFPMLLTTLITLP